MYFSRIKPINNLSEIVMIDEERAELYVQTREFSGTEEIPEELSTVPSGGCERVYGIDPDGKLCEFCTWKHAIRYSYENESYMGMHFSECTVMEYSSDTLTSFMCAYPDDEEMRDSLIDFEFDAGGVNFRFCGYRLHIAQRNPEYEMYDPAVIITFPEEVSIKEKICCIHAIDDMLRLVFFQKKIARPQVKFTRPDLDEKTYLKLWIYDEQGYFAEGAADNRDGYRDWLNYTVEELPVIMDYLVSKKLKAEYFDHHYRLENFQIQKLFADTYFVFDELANKAYGKADALNLDFEAFKKRIWEEIEKSPEYEAVKPHTENLKVKIMSHGRERGHRDKLRKAIEEVFPLIPNRICFYERETDLNKIVKRIYDLRTGIVHKGDLIHFGNEERFAVEELQWLTYALQLRETGVPDDKLEEWLDRAFGVG